MGAYSEVQRDTPTTLANRAAAAEVGALGGPFMESTLNHRYSSLHLPATPTYRPCLFTATELEDPGEGYYSLWAEFRITKLSTSTQVQQRQWGPWQAPISFTDFTR